MGGQLFRITFTKLRTFDQCRKRYWFRYLSGRPYPEDVQTPALVVGKAVHRALKALCDTGDPRDGASALDVYLRMPAHACAGPGTAAHDDAFELYERGCEAHASIDSAASWPELDTWVHSERRGVQVNARLDRADRLRSGAYQIVDWKTGRLDSEDDIDVQLDIGHLALRTSRKLPAAADVIAVAWNLRTGRRRERHLTRDDARATMDHMGRMAARLQATTEFEASPTGACRYCEWRAQCPEANAGDDDYEFEPDLFEDAP